MLENSGRGKEKKQDTKLVSIIVPVYNTAKYLERCITSILSQTYKEFELLLIDDGSTDNSLDICERFAKLDNRISVFNLINSGVSYARNLGIEKANGSYIMFIDSDDFICEFMIADMVYEFEENIGIILCGYNLCASDTMCVSSKILSSEKKIIYELDDMIPILEKCWSPWGKLYRREIIDNIRFNENVSMAEDLKFNVDILINNDLFGVKILDSALYNYRINSFGIMKAPYSKRVLDALLTEERVYKDLLRVGCSEDSLCKIFFNGVMTFYDRFSLLERKERKIKISDYNKTRVIISNYRNYLLKKNGKSKKEILIIRLIVYFPYFYFALKVLYSKVQKF